MKICKNCGAEIQDGAAFCTHCGTKVEEQKVEEQRVEPEKTEQTAQPVEPEQTSGQSQAEGQNAGAQNVNGYCHTGKESECVQVGCIEAYCGRSAAENI